jgi:hypothetical protein
MIGSRITKIPPVPSTTAKKSQTVAVSFKGGIKSYLPNDDIAYDELVSAQDMRMIKIGTYQTRKGVNKFVDAIGKTQAITQWPASPYSTNMVDGYVMRQKFTPTANLRLWEIHILVGQTVGLAGTLSIEIYDSINDTPSQLIGATTLSAVQVRAAGATLTELQAQFIAAPDLLANTEYFIVIRPQSGSKGAFGVGIGTTSTSTGAALSMDGGLTWQDLGQSLVYKLFSATPGDVRNIFVANNNGTYTTFFLFNNILYRADSTGVVTVQNSSLPANIQNIYFSQSQLDVRYTYGQGEARKIDLTNFSETEIAAGRGGARNIYEHNQYLFYLSDDDKNGVYTSEAEPDIDSFDVSQSFVAEIPAPNCGDDIVAMKQLGGVLYFFTRRNKYALYGDDWQSFSVNDAASRKGTFSQDSVTADTNFIYYATDTGIQVFNGTSEDDLTKDTIQDVWSAIVDKTTCKLDIHDNRLFVFYSDLPSKINNKCLVYNLNLSLWESFDTDTYVSSTCARNNPEGRFVQGSSRVGALFYGEEQSNDHDNLGARLQAELATSFMHFGEPMQLKRIPKLRPEFEGASGNYSVDVGFAKDFSHDVNYAFSINLATGTIFWDSGFIWDNGEIWRAGARGTRTSTRPFIYGEFRRCQLRYRHYAAHEPITFLAHTMTIQTQRIR